MVNDNLQMPSPIGFLERSLERAADLVAFSLQAVQSATVVDLKIPGSFGQVSSRSRDPAHIEGIRAQSDVWVVANGIRDCTEALGAMLEWARAQCVIWSLPGPISRLPDGGLHLSAQMTGHTWNKEIVAEGKAFDWFGLDRKLQYLEEKFGLPKPELTGSILSLNAARNCMAHRMGVVGGKDVGQDGAMTVSWVKLELSVTRPEGTLILSGPTELQGGETVAVRFIPVNRVFQRGDRIAAFAASDFVDICTTFLVFGRQVEGSLRDLQERRFSEQQGEGRPGGQR